MVGSHADHTTPVAQRISSDRSAQRHTDCESTHDTGVASQPPIWGRPPYQVGPAPPMGASTSWTRLVVVQVVAGVTSPGAGRPATGLARAHPRRRSADEPDRTARSAASPWP